MKLLTKEIKNKLPKLYETDSQGDSAIAQVKFFHPFSHWTWYALEFDGKDTFFGYVKSDCPELGYFNLSELESVKVHGLGIERDMHFEPVPLSEIKGE